MQTKEKIIKDYVEQFSNVAYQPTKQDIAFLCDGFNLALEKVKKVITEEINMQQAIIELAQDQDTASNAEQACISLELFRDKIKAL